VIGVAEPVGNVRFLRIDTGKAIARFDEPSEDCVVDIAFSPDGRYLMGVNRDETTHHVWDLRRLRGLAELKLDGGGPLWRRRIDRSIMGGIEMPAKTR
jgi:WD40 repeat protein